jgi:predicted nucleic acid-binding protein
VNVADVLLDACCLINLFSSGQISEILRAIPHNWHVCAAVAGEALFVDIITPEGTRKRIPADLDALFKSGAIRQCEPKGDDEFAAFVRYAAHLDDGEAMCFAIAKCRGWAVASDERKGRKIASADGIALINTIELIRAWAHRTAAAESATRDLIGRVTVLGRYRPASDVPFADWWRKHVGS